MDEQIKELMDLYGISDEQAREALLRLAQIDARLYGVA